MTRTFACFAPALLVTAFALPAAAQSMDPSAPGSAPPGYPGYPGGSGAPGTMPAPGAPGQPLNTPPSDDESQDSGLGLEWLWLNAEGGYAYTDMASFSSSNLGMQKTASGGPVVGAAVGARLLFFTVAVRARDLILSDIGNLWEIGGEAAFHFRIGHLDPYLGVRGGYNFVGQLNASSAQAATGDSQGIAIHGFDVGPMFGIDYYFNHWVSIGADIDAQFLFLQRPKIPIPANVPASAIAKAPPQVQQLYNDSGSSAGIQIAPTAHLGIHF